MQQSDRIAGSGSEEKKASNFRNGREAQIFLRICSNMSIRQAIDMIFSLFVEEIV